MRSRRIKPARLFACCPIRRMEERFASFRERGRFPWIMLYVSIITGLDQSDAIN